MHFVGLDLLPIDHAISFKEVLESQMFFLVIMRLWTKHLVTAALAADNTDRVNFWQNLCVSTSRTAVIPTQFPAYG
jgi:hypothetical protein